MMTTQSVASFFSFSQSSKDKKDKDGHVTAWN